MAEEKADYSKYILPVGLLAIGGLVLQKFGLLPSNESRKREQNAAALDKAAEWRPKYSEKAAKAAGYKRYTIKLLKSARALAYAVELKKAKGIFNDDEDRVYSILKQLQYKTQIAQVAEAFYKEYKKDLVTYLQSFMNEKELARIFDLTADLPTGVEPA